MKQNRLVILVAIFFSGFAPAVSLAQSGQAIPGIRHAIYADLGLLGYGGVFTFNYESRIWDNRKAIQLRARTGFGAFGVADLASSRSIIGAPINLTLLLGKKKHFFELTAGGIVGLESSRIYEDETKSIGIWPLVDIGYRFERAPEGIILRVKIGTGGVGGGIGYGF